MNNISIEAVIFDLGGVLIEVEFELAFKAVGRLTGQSPETVRHKMFGSGYGARLPHNHPVIAYELGVITSNEFHRHMQVLLGQAIPFQDFRDIWNCIFTEELASTVELVRELLKRPGLKVGVLSNTNEMHLTFLRGRMPVLNEIEHVYASHEIRLRKPHRQSFYHTFEKMKVRPQHSVFIDDFAENVAAAASLGTQVIHATDPAAVRAGLLRLGLP
jgi:HAD superfamily hydrolase (TIGR01509 family)